MSTVYVRIKSHRARSNFMRWLGRTPQPFYIWEEQHNFYPVTAEEWQRFTLEKKQRRSYWHGSVTRARIDESELRQCWPSGVTP